MTVKIVPNEKGSPPGKLADAELHFSGDVICHRCDGAGGNKHGGGQCDDCKSTGRITNPLAGLKLIGFSCWSTREGGRRNVTFPARTFSIGGERRSFALLRPITDAEAQNKIRDVILKAYEEHEKAQQ